jgi:uncharacterized protein (TIGR03083 family)
MAPLPAHLYHAQIEASSATFAAIASAADPDLPVPSCPDWSLRQLTTHTGQVHRWAAELVGTRSASYIEFGSVPDSRPPGDGAALGRWLTEGAARLVAVLREAGQDPVWAFGATAPASFWARRQAHETMVHCADAQLTVGDQVRLPAGLAADAIDEFLTIMSGRRRGGTDPRAAALAPGTALHVHATDHGLSGNDQWLVRRGDDGVVVLASHDGHDGDDGDVTLAGPAGEVLLVLLRRRPIGEREDAAERAVRVLGNRAVLDQWLDQTSF